MTISAFGIEHDELAKADHSASAYAAGGTAGGLAGATAARQVSARRMGFKPRDIATLAHENASYGMERAVPKAIEAGIRGDSASVHDYAQTASHAGRSVLNSPGFYRMQSATGRGLMGGAAVGAAGVAALRSRKKIAAKARSLQSKRDPRRHGGHTPPTVGRIVTGGLFPGWHGAVAGKPGDYHKLKAASYEVGGGLVAGPPGSGVGTYLAHEAGHYQKQPKRKKRKTQSKRAQEEIMTSAFGVDHGAISKASAFGTSGDKRNTKYYGSAYGGALAGGATGRAIAARSAGTSMHEVNRATIEGSLEPERLSRAVGRQMDAVSNARNFREGFKGGINVARANKKEALSAMKAVPGGARALRGGQIGAASGAVGGVAAYAAHRRKKRATE